MNFTSEQIQKAKQAKTAEELMKIAKENGVELTEEQAKQYFAELHKEGELSDDELLLVAGGKNDEPTALKCGDIVEDNITKIRYKILYYDGWVPYNAGHFFTTNSAHPLGTGHNCYCAIIEYIPDNMSWTTSCVVGDTCFIYDDDFH